MNDNMSRSSKKMKTKKYDDDDYEDDDDEDEEDEDDPDDADFDPDYGGNGNSARNKDNEWNSDGSDEEVDNDFDLDVLDENDVEYIRKPQRRARAKVKLIREPKSFSAHNRQRRGRAFLEDEDSSEMGSENDSGDDIKSRSKRGTHSRKNNSGRLTLSTKTTEQNGEVRTSSRAVRKVSYVESEESEDVDEGKTKKGQKEDIEEDDGDSIEKVLWLQPKGMADEALRKNESAQPSVLGHLLDSEPDWNEVEFFIKWKGQSYLHCQWKSYSDLKNLSGFKKVINYTKRVLEERKYRNALSREEVEVHDVGKEMELDLIKQYSQVDRIFSDRITKNGTDDVVVEYLVKWQGLSYAEATWEKDVDISFAQDAIDEYKAREAMTVQGKTVDFQRKKIKGSLRKLDEQPEWLKGGKLRDYQLEGLNFLVNSWRNDTNVILADEMGLGKTVQSVSMLGFLQNAQQIHGPFLVVVPLSTLSNWAKEFRKWLPEMNIVVYIGNRSSREVCQQYEFYTNDKGGRAIKFDALLTTYEVVLKDKAVFSKIKWNYLMVDEAHRLKNCEASLYTTLSEFSTKNKLLITGTPLQNSVEELWALLHFLDYDKFKNKEDFIEKYKNLSSFNETELGNLHKELRPHILRRVIKDVEKSLPPKIERILRVEMSPLQKQGFQFQRLDGSTRADLRHQAMEHFNAPGSDDFCFLLSTRAGGLGINLATADTVIIFDSDWNPQNDLQNELSAILRFGAEELFKEDKNDEENKKKLLSMDIDEILERAEKVETKGAEGEQGNELLSAFKVASFCSAEDDATFWSRWIQPDAVAHAEDALAPRAARNKKSYVEAGPFQPEKSSKRKGRGIEFQDRASKRRKGDYSNYSVPMIEGATAQVREWSCGNLSKKDAILFARVAKKFGNPSQIDSITAEVGGAIEAAPPDAQIELFDALIDGCKEAVKGESTDPKGPLLDFFGVPVKALELLDRVQELQLLAKRIRTYKDPVAQFRLLMHFRGPPWSKGCGWNQVDDARLLLGVHYYGFGNWEKIRLDPKLGLTRKIAPATLAQRETFLPRAPNLDQRASALLRKPSSKAKMTRKASKNEVENVSQMSNNHFKDGRVPKPNMRPNKNQKYQRVEPTAKEEGEMSDTELYQQFKEEKWSEWCADVMSEEEKTLKRLERLQHTSADLPKEKVLSKIRNYLQLLGRRIDEIVQEHEESYKQSRMSMRLWNYVSNFSNLSGERLRQIYSKLKQEQQADAGAGPSYINSSAPGTLDRDNDPHFLPVPHKVNSQKRFQRQVTYQPLETSQIDQESGKSEAWKRRKRVDVDMQSRVQPQFQPVSNGNRLHDPNSLGILGRAPGDKRRIGGERPNRTHQTF
ncbi:hypothetical protein Sjap_002203 [Stephania japonica]|uniref:Protein CHROMATIN REMODELING 5 n=1 Tax=Stephania japonica TaxID=461633 RepID=A0AAP0KLH5_9MAGN